jgi:hypothetical protein
VCISHQENIRSRKNTLQEEEENSPKNQNKKITHLVLPQIYHSENLELVAAIMLEGTLG